MRSIRLLREVLLPCCIATASVSADSGPRPIDIASSNLPLGEPGIAWYTTWESAWREARRSNRPIMFVAAATQCGGIAGVF